MNLETILDGNTWYLFFLYEFHTAWERNSKTVVVFELGQESINKWCFYVLLILDFFFFAVRATCILASRSQEGLSPFIIPPATLSTSSQQCHYLEWRFVTGKSKEGFVFILKEAINKNQCFELQRSWIQITSSNIDFLSFTFEALGIFSPLFIKLPKTGVETPPPKTRTKIFSVWASKFWDTKHQVNRSICSEFIFICIKIE